VITVSKRIGNRIPTNIVTGFLGVGKTTVIRHLLAQKPKDERWAVLVNEFGEVGIDGSLFEETVGAQRGVTISQVPGGCMCCANGLPMQMALSLLLAKSKPHRLLIEPTGLGHPREVLAILTGEYYRDALNLQATLALVDARKIQDGRYTANSTFNEQLEIAEVVIANKADLYEPGDFPLLLDYIDGRFGLESKLVYQVRHGTVNLDWLAQSASARNRTTYQRVAVHAESSALPPTLEAPAEGFVRADNSGEGFFSRGWIFNPGWQFDAEKLMSLFQGIEAERMKGVFITSSGIVGFNKIDNVVTRIGLDDAPDSRVEVISSCLDSNEGIEAGLLACIVTQEGSDRTAEAADTDYKRRSLSRSS